MYKSALCVYLHVFLLLFNTTVPQIPVSTFIFALLHRIPRQKYTILPPHNSRFSVYFKKKLDLFIVGYGMRARHDACVEVRGQLLGLSLRPSPNPPSLRIKHRLLSLGTGAFICCVTVGCGVCTCMVHVYSWRTRVKMVSLRASTLSAVSTLSH